MNRELIHYKIIFTGPGNEVEIRYLVMETISYHNYLYFTQKLTALFPILDDLPFSVNWKDKEGDIIRICSDDELTIALDEMKPDPVKKIFITVKQPGNETMLYPGIVCAGCDDPVKGFRYKCLICSDYDLCSNCEILQTHPNHPMLRIPKPLSPDTPYGKQFTKDIPKISQHLEHLFQQTGNDTSQSSDHKSPIDNKRRFEFCQNDVHNLIANLLVEKLTKHSIETSNTEKKCQEEKHNIQSEPSSSASASVEIEPQNVNILMKKLKSSSVDVNSGVTRRERLTEQEEPVHSTSGGQRLETFNTSPSDANLFSSTTGEAATTSQVLPVKSNAVNQLMSQIDAAPNTADPTPVLQAQLNPPISSLNIVPLPTVLTPVSVSNVSTSLNNTVAPDLPSTAPIPVSLSTLIASASAEDSIDTSSSSGNSNFPIDLIPPPIEDDGSLDNSWTIVRNEQSHTSTTSSDSIAIIDSPELTPLSTPQETDSPHTKEIGPYEGTIMMLHTLGFEKKEWLNLVVKAKEGDIREVLQFLSPIKKTHYQSS